jgi:hypothetical protein
VAVNLRATPPIGAALLRLAAPGHHPHALSLILGNGTLLLFGVIHLWLLRGVGPGAW